MIKIILLLLFILINSYGCDYSHKSENSCIETKQSKQSKQSKQTEQTEQTEDDIFEILNGSGEINLYYDLYKRDVENKQSNHIDKNSENYALATMQLNLEYYEGKFYFQATPFMYFYKTKSGDKLKFVNFYDKHEEYEIFFRSLYMSYNIYKNITVGVGVLPFSNSAPTKFNKDYNQDGEGINMLNDNALTSVFVLINSNNTRNIFGIGTIDDILVPNGNYIDKRLEENSYTIFYINTYSYKKFHVITELLYNDIKYRKIDLADIYLAGVNISYDDSEYSGYSFYTTLGASLYNNHNYEAKNTILNDFNIPSYAPIYYPDSFTFDEDKNYYGAAFLVGGRKDFYINDYEFFINAEWFHTFGDWSSGNQGNLYQGGKCNQTFSIRDNAIYSRLGWIINNNQQLHFTYQYMQFKNSPTIGMPAKRVDKDKFIGNYEGNVNLFQFNWLYKF